jgi:hypothetical protein
VRRIIGRACQSGDMKTPYCMSGVAQTANSLMESGDYSGGTIMVDLIVRYIMYRKGC